MKYLMPIIHKILKAQKEYIIPLAHINIEQQIEKNAPMVLLPFEDVWTKESFKNKLLAFIKLKYNPSAELLSKVSKNIFMDEIFGTYHDMSEVLYMLMIWHYSRDWEINNLTEADTEKADALVGMTLLTNKRYWDFDSENLNMKLAEKNLHICSLVCATVAKIPIISIRYFINVDVHFAFNSIRKAKHKHADEIIAYLYEVLNIQQKIAILFHSLVGYIVALENKSNSSLHKSEIDATHVIESIITVLKSSVEKTVLLLGYIFEIKNLESKKTHKSKLSTLASNIPKEIKELDYYKFIEKFISSDELDELNRNRTGLLHKKGLSKLQPHSHYMQTDTADIFTNFFYTLHEQHSKNSAVIISVIALLTDELVKLDRPNFSIKDIPCKELKKYFTA